MKLLLGFSWIKNVALFMGPQYSEQNQSMANNGKVTLMNLASRWSYFCTYPRCWSENFLLWMGWGGGGAGRLEDVPRVVYETSK